MKVINIQHPHQFNKNDFPEMAMALGFFDGVHNGHQEVILTAIKIANENNWKSAVMTFDPHPSVVLGNKSDVQYITPLKDKIELISSLHVDYLFVVHFTTLLASLEPEMFATRYLTDLNVQHVIAGFDYTYGRFGKGTMQTLPVHSKGNFNITVVPKLAKQGEKVSSTSIRKCLNDGDMIEAQTLLGRFYITKGTVIHGEKRGRTIGFPTANISTTDDYFIPKTGVYAVRLQVEGVWQEGVCNVGYKPTFNSPEKSQLSVEVYLFDFDRSIYDEKVVVEWHIRIRDEKKFNGIEELKTQINRDKEAAISYFKELNKET